MGCNRREKRAERNFMCYLDDKIKLPTEDRQYLKRLVMRVYWQTRDVALEIIADPRANLHSVNSCIRLRLEKQRRPSHKHNAAFRRRQRRAFLGKLKVYTEHIEDGGCYRTVCGLAYSAYNDLSFMDALVANKMIATGWPIYEHHYLCPKCRQKVLDTRLEKMLARRANWEDGLLSTPESYYAAD